MQNIDHCSRSSSSPHEAESLTEVMPRIQIHPTHLPEWHPCIEWANDRTKSRLQDIDRYSCSTSHTSGNESASEMIQPMLHKNHTTFQKVSHPVNASCENLDEYSFSANSSKDRECTVEDIPHSHIQPSHMPGRLPELDRANVFCPVETPLPPIHPCDAPSREVEWEEEPLPRGYERVSQLPCIYDSHIAEFRHCNITDSSFFPAPPQRPKGGNENSASLMDDLFSLLS